MARETTQNAEARWDALRTLQEHYASFGLFLQDMMAELGFKTTEIQHDIAMFLEHGPEYLMVQAQRGEAKTTITAIFAVWCLLHNPALRILIVSAGGTAANNISTLIKQLICNVDVLACLKPDAAQGDRTAVEGFDVHYSLKGMGKDPSVACIGIGGNLPSKRADLVIADDVESTKNSLTATMRATLMLLTLEFTSICSTGRIVYLGTPQTGESIYNTLDQRGFTIRVWPGRYPTAKEEANYGDMLAPLLIKRMRADPSLQTGGGLDGSRGAPTDPQMFDEETLCKKQMQGETYFQLNYMLNTRLSDALRYPLKTENIIVLSGNDGVRFPSVMHRQQNGTPRMFTSGGYSFRLGVPMALDCDYLPLETITMYVDPAGGGANADETAYAVCGLLNGTIFVLAIGGIPGGYGLDQMQTLADIVAKWKPNKLIVEKNMGYGAFTAVWLPVLRKALPESSVTDDYVTGQKEKRIIGTLEAIIGRGALVFLESAVESDADHCAVYTGGIAITYSVFHQLAKITPQKNALVHDDRADALEGACRDLQSRLTVDQDKRAEELKQAELAAFMADPFGHKRCGRDGPVQQTTMLSKYKR